MPKLSFIDSLLRRGKRSIPPNVFETGPIFNAGEGEEFIVTYTPAVDRLKFFSAFIREGLMNGDIVFYTYPNEESKTVRAKLKEYGIDAEKHVEDGILVLRSLTEFFMPEGKLDYDKAVVNGLIEWTEAKRNGYKHSRSIEDFDDFSFCNGQWQKFVTDYYDDPRWSDPNVSEWVSESKKENRRIKMVPFIIDITAINVERMPEAQVIELVRAFNKGRVIPENARIDLIDSISLFSRSIGLDHKGLIGRNILLEFDPISNYEKTIDSLAKESIANVEPIIVFTSNGSPLHTHLAKQHSIKFFLTSISTSTPKSSSENEVLLPTKNAPLILDAIDKVLEAYANVNVCFVFDILSELLSSIGREKTSTFLRHALDMLSSENIISLFLLNTGAHETEVVSRLRNLFSNQLAYSKNGLEIVKTF